ncbi:MAG TPA: hypothetical protein VLA55_09660, partial [Ornithinibacter sp.]|nr:hypothetical protein [Ornithinibacter sp.]
DEPDPWDEPAAPTDRPSSDQSVDAGTPEPDVKASGAAEGEASAAPNAEASESAAKSPAAGFTGDAALLDEPDPWD